MFAMQLEVYQTLSSCQSFLNRKITGDLFSFQNQHSLELTGLFIEFLAINSIAFILISMWEYERFDFVSFVFSVRSSFL